MCKILFEGVDRSGKSTLEKAIKERFGYEIITKLPVKENIFIECVDFLTDENQLDKPQIINRLHLSELVYGPIKRNLVRFDFRQVKIIELLLLTLDSYNICTSGDVEEIKKRVMEEGSNSYINSDDVELIVGKYEIEKKKSVLTWRDYKIGDDIKDILLRIEAHFKFINEEEIKKFIKYRTIGNLKGRHLIVGDQYGPGLKPPLIPFGNNMPGLKLFEAIDISNLNWNDIIITNAFKPIKDSRQALLDEMNLPGIKTIICLGNNAFEEVLSVQEEGKILKNIIKIPHPSFSFGYHGEAIESYAMKINEELTKIC